MLADNFDAFEKGPVFHEIFKELLGEGIFNSDGQRTSVSEPRTASRAFGKGLKSFVVFCRVETAAQNRLVHFQRQITA
jgi:hypothetical protein